MLFDVLNIMLPVVCVDWLFCCLGKLFDLLALLDEMASSVCVCSVLTKHVD